MFELLYQYFQEGTNISKDRFNKISGYFKLRSLKRNEFLLRLGEICKYIYFVNSGCIRFFTTNEEGQELTRYFAFEKKFGTALTSFIKQKPSIEYMQSIMKSEVLMISRQDFYHLVEKMPEMSAVYRNILEMAYITSQERIYGFQGQSALERLRWLMAYQPKILSILPNKIIASYLGVTPFTLSRLKAEL